MRAFSILALLTALLMAGCRGPSQPPAATNAGPKADADAAAEQPRPSKGAPSADVSASAVPEALAFVRDGNVFILFPENNSPAQVTTMGNCRAPAWRRDGDRIAWVRDTDKTIADARGEERPIAEVWVSDPTGTDLEKLTAGPANPVSAVQWQEDGAGLIVVTPEFATSDGARLMNLHGLVSGEAVGCNGLWPAADPAAPYIIEQHDYTRGHGAEEIFLADHNLKRVGYAPELTDLAAAIEPGLGWAAIVEPDDANADWASQKDRLYLLAGPQIEDASWLQKNAKGDAAAGKVVEAPGLPARAELVYETAKVIGEVTWSWDGKYVAFVESERTESADARNSVLYVIEVATRSVKPLLRNVSEPTWRPVPGDLPAARGGRKG
jgi:predicted small lipoprotein YifL